jgi:Flp pilus assembly protein TadG
MNTVSLIAYWRGKIRDFGLAQAGNVAIIFGISALPIVGLIGVAVDYSRGNSAKISMQTALDATGLTLSKEAQSLTQAQMNEKALSYFLANFNRPQASNVTVSAAYADIGNGKYKLNLTAAAQIPATITSLLPGMGDHMNIGSETQVIWGYKKLELALALDNTGSMSSSGKMTQLKIAAKSLITTLKAAAKKDGDVKISIIPFSTDVNVGAGNVAANWIKWDDYGYCSRSQYTTKDSCENRGYTWSTNKNNWNGCVWDRNKNYDVKNTTPDTNIKATLFPAHQEPNCPVAMLPLTYDWNALTNKIDAMSPVGNTNVTIGMALAFQTLSPGAPYNAAAPNTELDKVVILLTDGENTENRFGDSTTTINSRTKLACDNVKAANIKVYTIRVINGNSSLLRECATNTSMYYDVQDASQLNAVFTTIANSLANLRLSQ